MSWAFTAILVPWTASGAPAASRRAQSQRPLAHLIGRAHLGRHAEPQRLRRVERVPEQEVALGGERPEQQRPDRGATVPGDEADAHVRIDDHGRVRHHDHVAQQRDRRAEPGRRAVEPAHDRDLDVEQVPDDLLRLAAQGVEVSSVRSDGNQAKSPPAENARRPR